MSGCGNDPRTVLTEGDREAVREFGGWLRARAAARAEGLPEPQLPEGMTRLV
ncbi:hypothetical protein GCM10010289_86410 [Streptomyces violascens]|nr:hypothetical protein GCM10010289_86410 [Streptomyces violascens]